MNGAGRQELALESLNTNHTTSEDDPLRDRAEDTIVKGDYSVRVSRALYFPMSALYEGRDDIPAELAPRYHVVVENEDELRKVQAVQPDVGITKYTIKDSSFDSSLYGRIGVGGPLECLH